MSAFIVSETSIANVMSYLFHNQSYGARSLDTFIEEGRRLAEANVISVKNRYPSRPDEEFENWPAAVASAVKEACDNPPKIDAYQALKSLDCLDYQCCEVGNWEGSLNERLIINLKSMAIQSIPEYEEAVWD